MANSKQTSRYREEMHRVASYSSWPGKADVCPLTLARTGFYYSGSNYVVFCWCCQKDIDANVYGSNLRHRHRIVAPNCPYITNADSGDVPLTLPTDFNIQVRNATETDHGKPSTGLNSMLEIICQRASRRGIFEQNILKLNRSEPDFDEFRREIVRLASFQDWPNTNFAVPDALARAGFFYTGKTDTVCCAFCRKFCDQWQREDIPLDAHKRLSPDCAFARNDLTICANVPKEDDILDQEVQLIGVSVPAVQVVPAFQMDGHAAEQPLYSRPLEVQTFHSGTLFECAQRPKHPDMVDVEVRTQSFYKSRAVIPKGQNPTVLAEAGFYYYGPSDYCKCFFCDGGLKNWQEDDDPWSEHARWYPRCEYTKNRKGPDFILTTQNAKSARLQEVQPRFAGATVLNLGSSVDPREIKARLDSDIVKKIIGMGYSRDLVQRVIRTRLETKGDDFPNAESLVEALLTEQERPTGSELTASASSSRNENTVPKQEANIQVPNPVNSAQDTLKADSSVQLQKLTSKSKGKNKKKKKKAVQSKTGNQSSCERQTMMSLEETETVDAEEEPEANPDESAEMFDDMEKSLLEENQLLKEARTCKVCMDKEVNIVFLPCGHLVCCQDCAPELRICAICRALIRGTVKTFLA